LVNDFVKLNNGFISVESEVGQRTTFILTLPGYDQSLLSEAMCAYAILLMNVDVLVQKDTLLR
jgi:chemotaxis protein histidine kinase CheA